MDDQPKDVAETTGQRHPIDPLRRVIVPREKQMPDGKIVFLTTDRQAYVRCNDGSIRREVRKINGKLARKLRAQQRRKV